MLTYKECKNMTHQHLGPKKRMGSGCITCDLGSPLKSWERGCGDRVQNIRDHK